jgi:hypothetical protein
MIPENSAAIVTNALPDIHVWMTPQDAASTLGVEESLIEAQIECGDLETRITLDNAREVLIRLPRRAGSPMAAAFSTQRRIKADDQLVTHALSHGSLTLLPIANGTRKNRTREALQPSLSTRLAWTSMAAILLLSCALGLVASSHAGNQRLQARNLAGELEKASAKAEALSAEREQLRDQLTQLHQSAAQTEEQLAVERNVEDQLLKAAIAAHNARAAQGQAAVFADSSR